MTKLRFTRSWRAYRTGQVADIAGGLAAELIAKRVAVEDRQGNLIETAAADLIVETADTTPRKRGRRAVQKPSTPDTASG